MINVIKDWFYLNYYPMEKTSLYFKSGGSDKEYHVQLHEGMVTVQYGRRGNALTSLIKCEGCAPEKALKVYQSLIKEKMAKGYQLGGDGVAYSAPTDPNQVDYHPQLLNEIDEDFPDKWIQDDDWLMQEKEDGRNIGIIFKNGKAVASNKKGLQIAIPEKIIRDIERVSGTHRVFCGELIGNIFKVWDVVNPTGTPDHTSYIRRYEILEALIKELHSDSIKVTRTAITFDEKLALFNEMKAKNAEGVVFKRKDSLYKPGRPNSGGDQLKFKFTATCSVIAGLQNEGKRSVEMLLYEDKYVDDNGRNPLISVGNVTIYPNQEIPKVGSICEIRYLYAFKGGSLFQPVFKEIRDDVTEEECTTAQLKYKRELEEEI